jgi:hypothetical protein
MLLLTGVFTVVVTSYFISGINSDYAVGVTDTMSYFTQAKIFSTGHINVPSHDLKEFFDLEFVINDGKFYSIYFPGWPLILSLGVILRAPWIINPLLSFLTLVVIYLTGCEVYNKKTGLVASILLSISFNFHELSRTYLSEPSALFFSSLFFYFMIKTLKKPEILTSSLAGISLGIVFLIRPYSAAAMSLPILSYFFFIFYKKKALSFPVSLVLCFLPFLFIFFSYNYFQTGSVFLTPYAYENPFNKLGFGLRSNFKWLTPFSYTPLDGLINVVIEFAVLNYREIPLLFIFLLIVFINKKTNWDVLLFLSFFSVVFFYFFFYFRSDTRYYYVSSFALSLLAARGIELADISFANIFPDKHIKHLNRLLLLFVIVANIFIITFPRIPNEVKRYRFFGDPFTLVKKNNLRNSVVFLRSVPGGEPNNYIQNPPDFNGDVLFAKDLKERNIKLMEYYPEKKFYVYEIDNKSRSGKLTGIK